MLQIIIPSYQVNLHFKLSQIKIEINSGEIFSLIGKHLGAVVDGFIDMFAYTSMLIPIMNGILYIVGKYDMNLDTICDNFMGLAMGIGTVMAKHGIVEILNNKF